MIDRALAIAVAAHAGQKDKQGQAYILHVLRVVIAAERGPQRVVAALHDVLEDSEAWTLARLEAEGFPDEILDAVWTITRRDRESYDAYIRRVAVNSLARAVKRLDLRDNLTRWTPVIDPERRLYSRYITALHFLEGT